MKFLLLLLLTTSVFAARESTIDADCVKLKGGLCVDKNELGYSKGVTSNIQAQLNASATDSDLSAHESDTATHGISSAIVGTTETQTLTNKTITAPVITTPIGIVKADVGLGSVDNTSDLSKPISTLTQAAINTKPDNSLVVHNTGNESIAGVKTFTGKTVSVSTVNGSLPCPVMTDTQMLAISSPSNGDCAYNSDKKSPYFYSSLDTKWKLTGGGGGDSSNILINADFSSLASDWSVTSTGPDFATSAVTSGASYAPEYGESNLSFNCNGITAVASGYCEIRQERATTSVVQGNSYAYVYVPNSTTIVSFHRSINGTVDTSDSTSFYINDAVKPNNRSVVGWHKFEYPFVLGSSSSGISVRLYATAIQNQNAVLGKAFLGPAKVTGTMTLINRQTSEIQQTATFGVATITGTHTDSSGSGLFTYASGIYTALRDIDVVLTASARQSGATAVNPNITVNGVDKGTVSITSSGSGSYAAASFAGIVRTGQTFLFKNSAGTTDVQRLGVLAFAVNSANTLSSTNGNTNPSPFTPTGSWTTNATYTGSWYREGRHAYISYKVSLSGATNAANLTFNIPSSIGVADVTAIEADPLVAQSTVGGVAVDAAVIGYNINAYFLNSSTIGILVPRTNTGTNPQPVTTNILSNTYPFTFGTGDTVIVTLKVPIVGWSNSNVIVASLLNTPNIPNVSKPKTCYYGFGGASATLAAPTECTTGTCVEVVDTCGTVTPPAWTALGIYQTLTFANGTFANSSHLNCGCVAYDTTSGDARKCVLYFRTGADTWAANSSGGYVTSVQVLSDVSTPAASNAYVQVKCEGQAP